MSCGQNWIVCLSFETYWALHYALDLFFPFPHSTVGQNSKELGCKYWATHSSLCSFAWTAHSFTCSALLALLVHSAALIRSLACSFTHSRACGEVYDSMFQNDLDLLHSASAKSGAGHPLLHYHPTLDYGLFSARLLESALM